MGVAMFASMWISNVAAPVLCFSIIQVRLAIFHPRSSKLI
jgi:phosphate transporter